MDDHFFTVYDVPATRLAIIGWRAGTRGRLHFRGLDPETKPQGREACGQREPFVCECGVVLESLAVDMTKGADRRLPFNPLFCPDTPEALVSSALDCYIFFLFGIPSLNSFCLPWPPPSPHCSWTREWSTLTVALLMLTGSVNLNSRS